jgi:hypothetical protein
VAVDVGEPKIAPGVVVDEAFVVESEEVQNRCLKVVNVDFILCDMEAEIVSFAVSSGFGAASCHKGGKSLWVMIATGLASEGWIGFDHGSAAELSSPDDQSLIKEPVPLEILNERGSGLGGLFAIILS